MKFVIEAKVASKPAWWLLDDDIRVVARQSGGMRVAISGDLRPGREAARDSARRAQRQTITAMGA